jgi:C4-dicarboxylate transporter DctM subunit
MVDKGYDKPFAAAVTAASSTMGPIIPPSILMVIMGVTTGVSIGGLFAAGIVPGLLIGFSMMGLCYFLAIQRNYPKDDVPFTFLRLWKAFVIAFPALLAPVIILGGILGGVFTATEAAVVAIFYSMFLGLFVYRELKISDLGQILINSATTTAVLLLIIAMANIFSWVLTSEQIPQRIAQGMLSMTTNPYLILLLVNVILLFVGMFLEGGAAIIILAPTLMGVAQTVGIDPLHFSFVIVLNLVIGLLTPPLGVCLFVVSGVTDTPLSDVIRAVIPFLLLEFAILFLVTYFPTMIMFLPRLFGYA